MWRALPPRHVGRMTLGGACRSCPHRRQSSVRQWSIHRTDFGCGGTVGAMSWECAGAFCRVGESCNFRSEDSDARLISAVAADPTDVAMGRVASAMRVIEELSAGQLAPESARETIRAISQAPPAATWLFTLAAAAGAAALAVIFGVQHLTSAAAHIRRAQAPAPFCVAAWRSTAPTSSCSHSVRLCSPALSARWRFAIS